MGVGVAGQQVQAGVAVVGAELLIPARSQQLEQGIDPGEHRGPPLHHRRTLLDHAAQRVRRTVTAVLAQALGMQQRKPSQQRRVQPVVLGVLGVVGTQVRRLSRRHQHDLDPAPFEPRRNRRPRIPGRLHHHRQLGRVAVHVPPQPLQVLRLGEERAPTPHQRPVRTRQRRDVRGSAWASPRIVEASSMMDGCADRGQGLASGGVFGEFFDGDHLLAAWADAASAQALAGS